MNLFSSVFYSIMYLINELVRFFPKLSRAGTELNLQLDWTHLRFVHPNLYLCFFLLLFLILSLFDLVVGWSVISHSFGSCPDLTHNISGCRQHKNIWDYVISRC